MTCGPIRHHVDHRKQAHARPFHHRVITRITNFNLPDVLSFVERPSIQEIYSALAADKDRNSLIAQDILMALAENRSPVLLTERAEHLDTLASQLVPLVRNVIEFKGGLGKRQRTSLMDKLGQIPDGD